MYRARLKRDLDTWMARGLLSPDAAQALLQDLDTRPSSFSAGRALMILAAILLSIAIVLLVAANWDAIPRLGKVLGIFVFVWLFHLSAAQAMVRERPALGHGLLMLGGANFGAGLALVGQLYHLQGDPLDFCLAWLAMVTLSCLLFRSTAMAGFAALLCFVALATGWDETGWNWSLTGGILPPLLAALMVGLSIWTRQHRLLHSTGLILLAWIYWLYSLDPKPIYAMILAGAGVLIFVATTRGLWAGRGLVQMIGHYGLVLAVSGLFLLHFDYDSGGRLAILAVATIALSVTTLLLRGRDDGLVRVIAYGVFAAEIYYLATATIDTMLGTSGFFLVTGVLLGLLALAVARVEKALAAGRAAKGAAA